MSTIYDLNPHPAFALYEHWHTILSTSIGPLHPESHSVSRNLHETFSFDYQHRHVRVGVGHQAEISVAGYMKWDCSYRPVIGLSRAWRGYNDPLMLLMPDGRFLLTAPRGGARNIISKSTFLDWGWLSSRVRWFVSPTHQSVHPDLGDWRKPVHSVGAWLPCGHLSDEGRWLELRHGELGWQIVLATWQYSPWDLTGHHNHYTEDAFRWDDRYLRRKWRRNENAWRRRQGLPDLPRTPAKVYQGNQTLTGSDAALAIAAVLSTETPAKTIRRRTRLIEAQKEDR